MNQVTEQAFLDELQKIAGGPVGEYVKGRALGGLKGALSRFSHMGAPMEVAGLGALAAPSVDNMIAKMRARRAGMVDAAGKPTEEGIESKRLIKEKWHDPIEVGGLGLLAAPYLAGRIAHGRWGH